MKIYDYYPRPVTSRGAIDDIAFDEDDVLIVLGEKTDWLIVAVVYWVQYKTSEPRLIGKFPTHTDASQYCGLLRDASLAADEARQRLEAEWAQDGLRMGAGTNEANRHQASKDWPAGQAAEN